jgi:hypothetical protein
VRLLSSILGAVPPFGAPPFDRAHADLKFLGQIAITVISGGVFAICHLASLSGAKVQCAPEKEKRDGVTINWF